MNTDIKKLAYKINEVAQITGLRRATIINAVKAKSIPAVKFGKIYLIPKKWIDQNFIENIDAQPNQENISK